MLSGEGRSVLLDAVAKRKAPLGSLPSGPFDFGGDKSLGAKTPVLMLFSRICRRRCR
jgi:hypothetical protein